MADATSGSRASAALLVLIGVLATEAPVDAYLDAGSGSMLLQVLFGGVAAIGVVAKLYWHRVTSRFRRAKPDDLHQ
jgi:hypothetical protein